MKCQKLRPGLVWRSLQWQGKHQDQVPDQTGSVVAALPWMNQFNFEFDPEMQKHLFTKAAPTWACVCCKTATDLTLASISSLVGSYLGKQHIKRIWSNFSFEQQSSLNLCFIFSLLKTGVTLRKWGSIPGYYMVLQRIALHCMVW